MAQKGDSLNIFFDDPVAMFYGGEKLPVTPFPSAGKRFYRM
jgi:hypothetical protein